MILCFSFINHRRQDVHLLHNRFKDSFIKIYIVFCCRVSKIHSKNDEIQLTQTNKNLGHFQYVQRFALSHRFSQSCLLFVTDHLMRSDRGGEVRCEGAGRRGRLPMRAVPRLSHASEVTPRFDQRRSTLLTDSYLSSILNRGIQFNGIEFLCAIFQRAHLFCPAIHFVRRLKIAFV